MVSAEKLDKPSSELGLLGVALTTLQFPPQKSRFARDNHRIVPNKHQNSFVPDRTSLSDMILVLLENVVLCPRIPSKLEIIP